MGNSSAPIVRRYPVRVEILAYAPTQFFHCQHCELVWQQVGATGSAGRPGVPQTDMPADSFGRVFHQEQLESSIPDDLKREYAALSAWARETADVYGGRVSLKLIDAASLEGLLKAVRYGVHRFPAFVVEGRDKYVGTDFDRVNALIQTRVAPVVSP